MLGMKYAVNLNTVLPVRAEPRESSEMVTQLLFGEFCRILGEENGFCLVENYLDGYKGWADKKMLHEVEDNIFHEFVGKPSYRTKSAITEAVCLDDDMVYRLSAGSLLPFYKPDVSTFGIADRSFRISPGFAKHINQPSKHDIIENARMFLNTPYLWGGKNIFGIDCSGFVQVVYSLSGYFLPRDASLQEKEGKRISGLPETISADLMFFEKSGKIAHVGIYLGNNRIIHSSGKVRIDKVDEHGIFNEEVSGYTHRLASIKRI